MSKYVFITGEEKNSNNIRNLLLRAYADVQEMNDIGDDDLDSSIYLVYSCENSFIDIINTFAEDYNLKTVEVKHEFEVAPSLRKPASFFRTFKEWNKLKVVFENSDVVVCIGEPTEYSNAAHMFGCKVIHYK